MKIGFQSREYVYRWCDTETRRLGRFVKAMFIIDMNKVKLSQMPDSRVQKCYEMQGYVIMMQTVQSETSNSNFPNATQTKFESEVCRPLKSYASFSRRHPSDLSVSVSVHECTSPDA